MFQLVKEIGLAIGIYVSIQERIFALCK